MLDGFIWDGDGFEGNIEMNEKVAREILKTGQWDSQGVGLCGEIAAKHYLLALDKAKGLEEAIKKCSKEHGGCYYTEKALAKWEEEK